MQVVFSTLRDRISNKHKSYKTHVKSLQALKKPEEATLLDHIAQAAQSEMPMDHRMVRANASDIAGCYLGKNWSRWFKKCNPQVITAKSAKLDPKQAKNFMLKVYYVIIYLKHNHVILHVISHMI